MAHILEDVYLKNLEGVYLIDYVFDRQLQNWNISQLS